MKPISAEAFIKKKNKKFEESKKKPVKFKDIGRKGKHAFYREAWTFMSQSNLGEKVFVIERLKRAKTEGKLAHKHSRKGDIEYRIGYYIVGKNGNKKGKWTWGQFCPLIPKEDLNNLFDQAKRDGVLL